MRNIIKVMVPVFIVVSLFLTGCGKGGTLEDTTWVLESYGEPGNLKTVLGNTEITATFDSNEQKVTGSGGCNNYFGGYELRGDKLSLPGPIAITEMSCGEEIDKQEYEYMRAFQFAESYRIDGDKLQINCGNQVLNYVRKWKIG